MRILFETEYRKIEKSLFLVAFGYLHNTEDAEDCVQEAALAAYQAFPHLRRPEYFKTWVTRIVINKSKDFLRRKRCTEELTDSAQIFCHVPAEDMEIIDAVCRMDPKHSVYITLRFYHDMTYAEMARSLKLPPATVKYRTKRALEELKNTLEGGNSI